MLKEKDPRVSEKEAYELLVQGKYEEAFHAFREAGDLFRDQSNHKQSSLCYSSAASCWALRQGEKVLQSSAISYEAAAAEAEKAADLEYASLLYRYAAINYEKDMEFLKFSECFFLSKECLRRHLMYSIFSPHKIHNISTGKQEQWTRGILKRGYHWLGMTFSALLWGHGERPVRTFGCAISVIFFSAFLYTFANLSTGSQVFRPDFLKALYFSVVTFTTVGYGDIYPVGAARIIAMCEAFSGIFVGPILIVSLSRKFLRI
jgi:tetratricopeptide (TPR) repeat protein